MKFLKKLAKWGAVGIAALVLLTLIFGPSDEPVENAQVSAPATAVAEAPVETLPQPPKASEPKPAPEQDINPEPEAVVAQPAVDVKELTCPELAEVDLKYSGKVQVRRIAADIVNQWGLKAGPLDVLPENETRSFYWVSSAAGALFVLARNADWTWYRDGDTVRFVKPDDPVLKTARVIATELDLKVRKVEGGLAVTIESDLGERQAIRISVFRSYRGTAENGKSDTYSRSYGRRCGLAAQWRVTKFIPVDNQSWRASLIAHQDTMSRLGPDMAFEIGEIHDHITIEASARGREATAKVQWPLTLSVRARSSFVGADHLVLWEAYELLAGAPLIARASSPSERGRRLAAGEVFRVEGIEHSQLERWYLVSIDGRQGWINSIALLREGVKRVSTPTDEERKAADLHRKLMANVIKPCLDYAYVKVVKGQGVDSHSARLAMFESVQPYVKEMVAELTEVDLNVLPESETQQFYRKSLANCKSGIGQP